MSSKTVKKEKKVAKTAQPVESKAAKATSKSPVIKAKIATKKAKETFTSGAMIANNKAAIKKPDLDITQDFNRQRKTKGWFQGVVDSFVGEGKELERYYAVAKKIVAMEPKMAKLSDSQLRAKTFEFRSKLTGLNEKETVKKLDELLPEAFAVVREGAYRAIGMKHYPVQLVGGMVLHEGRVAEMKTGEGKTLVSTLAIYLNALPPAAQVHLVTVNDYLARRDASWMGQVYNFLGLTTGIIQNQASFRFKLGVQADEISEAKRARGLVETYEDGSIDDSRSVLDVEHLIPVERREAYYDKDEDQIVDIVYGVNSEFGFDYLRDNMAKTAEEVSQKAGHAVAIVDEVDSILIDEARTPLIISSQDSDSSARYKQFSTIVKQLSPEIDYEVDEKRKVVLLTDLGVEKIERILNTNNLYQNEENVVLVHHLDQALKAQAVFKREKEYVVRDGEIVIVDESTGRLMFGRRYNQGLHQAIEAKENIEIKPESKTTATVTFQNYFRLYNKLAGMTGTAATESEELFKIYKLVVVTIPTNKPVIRKDHEDKVFKNELGKFRTVVADVKRIHETGQPILIGTSSIEKNNLLGQMLDQAGIAHQVLNAKNHEQEARIISQAGKLGAVTLATNIAGRGVDIKLGGEVPEDADKKSTWKLDNEKVKELGGLYVVGTERHESRRIDNQLRGRSGRQGDNGASQFYVSLEDYIIRVFGGDRLANARILQIPEDQPIQIGLVSWSIQEAQKRIESQNYDARKNVTEYDDVTNRQRTVIYARRKKVLLGEDFHWADETSKALYREIVRIVNMLPKSKKEKDVNPAIKEISKHLKSIVNIADFSVEVLQVIFKDKKYNVKIISKLLHEKVVHQLQNKWEIYEDKVQSGLARYIFLRAIDMLWMEHLVTLDQLQDSVRLRGYSQKDPLVEFKQDGIKIFQLLLQEIDAEIARTIFKATPELVPAAMMK
jgi:preprotein translocase subunit SecA